MGRIQTLGEIATLQFQLGDRTAARVTFEQALRCAQSSEPAEKAYAFKEIIQLHAARGEFDLALDITESIDDAGARWDALEWIDLRGRNVGTKALGRMLRMIDTGRVPPDLSHGIDLRKERVNGLKIDALIGMALAEAKANDQAGVRRDLQRAMQVADTLQEEATRYDYARRITKALVRTGAAEEASRIAAAIGNTTWNRKLQVLINIAHAHEENGDRKAGQRAWQDALLATKTVPERFRVLIMNATAQRKAGDREAALSTLQQALIAARGIKEDDDDASGFEVAYIAKERATSQDIIGAIQLANTIENNQVRGDALAAIATTQAELGDINGALETAGTIKPPDPMQGVMTHFMNHTSALLGIVEVQARAGDVTGALATADRLRERDWRFNALIVIAEGIDQGRREKRGHL